MTCPNRRGSKAGQRGEARPGPRRSGAAPAPRHDGGPQGRAGASPGRPPLAGSPVIPGRRPTHQTALKSQERVASRCRRRRSQARSPLQVPLSAASCGSLSKQPSPSPRPTHTRGLPSPPPPLPSTVTIPVPVPKAASAHGPKRIKIWERGTDGRAREGLRLRSGDDRWRRRLRCWGGGRRGALSLRRAVSRRRRHRRRLSRRRREQNTENRGYKNSG